MRHFPIFLDFEGQRVLAVGGSEAILNKVRLLQRTSATIELVAEDLHPGLDGLVSHGGLAWVGRRFEPAQLDGVVAVFAAADDVTNKAVFEAARARNLPVNVVDRPELSTFLTPAIVDRDPLIVAIGTEGTGPVLAQGVRARIEAMLPYRIGELAIAAGRLRQRVAAAIAAGSGRRAFWSNYFFGPAAEAFFAGNKPRYGAAIDAAIEEAGAARPGRVSFLTAPADPELLTLKAHRKLQDADVIVHDSGADPRILDYARRDAARIAVEAACPDLLLREAATGAQVVRLRSEAARLVASSARELAALAAAGIAVEIVAGPGLATSAASETEWRAA
jgi:uroporphyrin-III C-methyltransferase / precorrin-2 dehydrogenase / sirohydrochlorin ferrochelatase